MAIGRRLRRRLLIPLVAPKFLAEQLEQANASVRAKVERAVHVVRQQFSYAKPRYRDLATNTA